VSRIERVRDQVLMARQVEKQSIESVNNQTKNKVNGEVRLQILGHIYSTLYDRVVIQVREQIFGGVWEVY
jgi:hypothetical protein